MASQTEENYLKALFILTRGKGEVGVSDLGNELGVSTPTANSMVKKLHDQNLVIYEKYKPLSLTEAGRRAAAMVIRKHRLTEMFLVEKMGFGWEEVHDIAEQIEHIKSAMFFDRMDELLGYPTVDPHGSPIPDKEGHIQWKKYDTLSDCAVGDRVRLAALIDSSDDFLKFLNGRDLGLDVIIRVVSIEPFDQSMIVDYGSRQNEVFSKLVCDRLLVERIKS